MKPLSGMFLKHGSVPKAWQSFDKCEVQDVASWNVLIAEYVNHGFGQAGINYLRHMKQTSVLPNVDTFVYSLKACGYIKDVEKGMEIHCGIQSEGLLQKNLRIGNTLVDMYVKCACFAEAERAFRELRVPDSISWNVLIGGYTKHGLGQAALRCFSEMQAQGTCATGVTFACILKAYGQEGTTKKGQEIHSEIIQKGLETNTFVSNSLIFMYGDFGLIEEVAALFKSLVVRDEISWNALIEGYVKCGYEDEAMKTFKQMQLLGITPNTATFICVLKSCGSTGANPKAIEIHAEISRRGVEEDISVGTTLVDMYAKCGLLDKAEDVFYCLTAKNVATWNALISGYVKQDFGDEAIKYFKLMQLHGISPNIVTYVSSFKACSSTGSVTEATKMHVEVVMKGWENELSIGSVLVDMYSNFGILVHAQRVFDRLTTRNVVSWTALSLGYAEHGFGLEAFKCFEKMQADGITPNTVTFVAILKACTLTANMEQLQSFHVEIARHGLSESSLIVGNTLIDAYAKCSLLTNAQEVFDRLDIRDAVSWNTLIIGHLDQGYNEEVLVLFKEMQSEGVSPSSVTFIFSLKAISTLGAISAGKEIHVEIVRTGLLEIDHVIANALLDMYAKCGLLNNAEEVLDSILSGDIISWNTLITGCAQQGDFAKIINMFHHMIEKGCFPNDMTFLALLSSCSHSGLVDVGMILHRNLTKEYGIFPVVEHYTCIIDLLARAGQLENVVYLAEKMPFHPNLSMCHSVLGGCRKWGNLDLGEQFFTHVVGLDEMDIIAYVYLRNIYADVDMQQLNSH